MKQEVTGWRLIPFIQCLDKLVKWLRDESVLRDPDDPNTKCYQDNVPITRALGEKAFKLTRTNGFFQEFKLRSGRRAFVSANPKMRLIIKRESAKLQLLKLLHKSWTSFDDYAASVNSVRFIIEDASINAFNGFTCYCEDFQKYLVCIDAIAVTHLVGSYEIPKEFQVRILNKTETIIFTDSFVIFNQCYITTSFNTYEDPLCLFCFLRLDHYYLGTFPSQVGLSKFLGHSKDSPR